MLFRQRVHSLAKTGSTQLFSDVTLSEGSNITLTQSGQNIAITAITASSLSIGSTVLSGSTGSILFIGPGPVLSQDNANLFWDDTNNRLGIGTALPSTPFHVTGNCTFGSTIWTLTTLTSFTMQDIIARPLLYADAVSFRLQTNPVYIEPTASASGTPAPAMTTTCPAHTNITANTEAHDLLINMARTVDWNAGTVPNQRALYIKAPTLTMDGVGTFTEATTVCISGVPTIPNGSAAQIDTAIGFKLEQVAIPAGVLTGIGFVIYAPTTAGASGVCCGAFMDGNVAINNLDPDTWLDVKVTGMTANNNSITCIDGTTRFSGMYVGGTSMTSGGVPGSGTSGFLLDFGWAPTSNSSFGVAGNQTFMSLEGSVNMTGAVTGAVFTLSERGTGGTGTSARALVSTYTTVSGSTRAVTTGRASLFNGSIQGTGTVTTYVGSDFTTAVGNVAVTLTTGHYARLVNPTKGAAATVTNWDSLLFEDNTMTVATRKTHIRALGSTTSRHEGSFMFGADAAPAATIDVNSRLFIDGATGKITEYNNIATVSAGVPAIYGEQNLTAQTAAVAATTLYTPAATGMFRIVVTLKVTTAATTSSTLGAVTITYTSGDGSVAQSQVMLLSTAAGAAATTSTTNSTTTSTLSGVLIIHAVTGVAIQYAIGYASVGATAMQYSAHLKVEAL